MKVREPKRAIKILWTKHSEEKMRFYNLSKMCLRKLLRKPDRVETGVALRTVAIMQKTGTKKYPREIWLMYQKDKKNKLQESEFRNKIKNNLTQDVLPQREKITIISAWRYPGVSPEGHPPIPEDIAREISNLKE